MNDKPFIDIKENLEILTREFEKLISTKMVFGEPMHVGEVTLIPVVDVMFGLGTGGGSGDNEKHGSGTGLGSGGAAKASPRALVAIKGGEVSVFPLSRPGTLEKLVEMIPQIVDKVGIHVGGKEDGGE